MSGNTLGESYEDFFNSGYPVIHKITNEFGALERSLRSTHDFTKDVYGRLLIANGSGLFWYDGFVNRPLKDVNGHIVAADNEIDRIISAQQNGVWILNKSNQLSFFSYLTHKEHKELTENISIKLITSLNDKQIIAASDTAVYLVSNHSEKFELKILVDHQGDSYGAIQGIDIYGELLFYTIGSKLFSFNISKQASKLLATLSSIQPNLLATARDKVWLFSKKRLLRINKGEVDREIPVCDQGKLILSSDKNIWVATQGCGVYVVDPRHQKVIRSFKKNSHPDLAMDTNVVRAIYEDDTGTIWLGRYLNSFAHINPNRDAFSNIINNSWQKKRLLENTIYKIIKHSSGDIWLAHAKGGISILDKNGHTKKIITTRQRNSTSHTNTTTNHSKTLPAAPIYSLLESKDGMVYAALRDLGIYRIDPRTHSVQRISIEEESAEIRFYNLVFSQETKILASGKKGISSIDLETGKAKKMFSTSGEEFTDKTDHSLIDNDGNIWFAAPNFLAVLAKDQDYLTIRWQEHFPKTENQKLINIFSGRQGRILAVIDDSLYQLSFDRASNNIEFEQLIKKLPHKTRGRFHETEDKKLISSHEYFDLKDNSFYQLGPHDGILSNIYLYYAQAQLDDEILLQGTPNGLIALKPNKIKKWNFDIPIVIAEARIDDQEVSTLLDHYVLPETASTITLLAAGLDYSAPKLVRYLYRIEGYQEQWLESDYNGRMIVLSQLPPGDHVLEIKARNRAGVMGSKTKSITITVQPEWHETYWFKIVIVFFVGLLLWTLYQLRVAQLKRQKRKLEDIVSERTENLRKSLNELENTKHKLVESEKQASLGRLVRGVSHELNTPIGVIKSSISLLESNTELTKSSLEDGSLSQDSLFKYLDMAKMNHKLVHKNIDRMALLTERFKQSSAEEQQGKPIQIDIKPLIESCINSVKRELGESKIEVSLDCPESLQFFSYSKELSSSITELFHNSIVHAFDDPFINPLGKEILIKIRPWRKTGIRVIYSDNGKGMSESTLKDIYEPFFSTSSKAEQIGLGLHSVFNWVGQTLQGEIRTRSTPNTGTVFILYLPDLGNLNKNF